MAQTVSSEFTIDEIAESRRDIWLEDRHPERAGVLIAVELDAEYDDDLRDALDELNEGDVIDATLESQNSLNTVWRFSEVDVRQSIDRSSAAT